MGKITLLQVHGPTDFRAGSVLLYSFERGISVLGYWTDVSLINRYHFQWNFFALFPLAHCVVISVALNEFLTVDGNFFKIEYLL